MALDAALMRILARIESFERTLERRVVEMPLSLTYVSVLVADVNISSSYVAGPAITIGPGTFLIVGALTVVDTGSAATFGCVMSDGSTNLRSTSVTAAAGGWEMQMSVSYPVVLSVSTTFSLYAKDITSANGKIKATSTHAAGGNTASYIGALKVG